MARERSYEIRVVGAKKSLVGDWYHELLLMKWLHLLGAVFIAFLIINALFAVGYVISGGVFHMRPHSYEDAFYFSAQTMGTIGYGAMYPESRGANLLVVAESFVSVLTTALSTGLIFTNQHLGAGPSSCEPEIDGGVVVGRDQIAGAPQLDDIRLVFRRSTPDDQWHNGGLQENR